MGSDYKNVFRPIRIRGVDFKNRIRLAPPSPNHAGPDGLVTHEFVDWFRMFARGGASVLYVGNCSIDINECKDEECQLDLSNPHSVLPISWYAEMAAAYDCHASLEINHNGKDTAFEQVGHAPFAPSPLIPWSERTRAERFGREPIAPVEMTRQKIDETIEKYANAAYQMKRAGMDIVLVHGGHGNLISQFMSPLYNRRTDAYGGSLENRSRFAIEVCRAIREKCGEEFVIEFRMSADEIADGGMHFPEALEFLGLIKNDIDIVHLSAGIHSDFDMKYYRYWCQNYLMPHMFNVHYARDVKKAYPDMLVTTVGSIMNLDEAEEILSNGWADFVAMCRPLMADPDMPKKYARNRPEEARPCLRCDACARRLGSGDGVGTTPRVINCAVNPVSGLASVLKEGVIPAARTRKKVGVVGGGLAGLHAMMAACDRGHQVILYEKGNELGGYMPQVCVQSFKGDHRNYFEWLKREVAKYKDADIRLNTEATAGLLDGEAFDALIIAVGADPVRPGIPGLEEIGAMWAPDAETAAGAGEDFAGEKIVIIGAGSVGVEAALDFYERGKIPVLVDSLNRTQIFDNIASGSSRGSARELLRMVEEKGIDVRFSARVNEIRNGKVCCSGLEGGNPFELSADMVLYAVGMRPRHETIEALRHCAPEGEVFIVGDARRIGNISSAVNQGFQAALHL
jgi:2,4-dienoyl-CoA reductase-like NADH-dependent reductase (Old Yellow Enzyme family)/NADPH-dependent 2,4-dienoyl-CoA reductase/sulfur reductase-like enzyme